MTFLETSDGLRICTDLKFQMFYFKKIISKNFVTIKAAFVTGNQGLRLLQSIRYVETVVHMELLTENCNVNIDVSNTSFRKLGKVLL